MKNLISVLIAIGTSLLSAFVILKAFDWLLCPSFGFDSITYTQALIIQFVGSFVRMPTPKESDLKANSEFSEKDKLSYKLTVIGAAVIGDLTYLLIFFILSFFI